MRAAVITFPGSNCDRDLVRGFALAGFETVSVWHKETSLPSGIDVVGLPGGFSYGDYLRCGAIAAQSPICQDVAAHAARGGYVLGICNGFQVLTETGLLPGALMRNAGLKFVCRSVPLEVINRESAFTSGFGNQTEISLPVAHHDGNYRADADTLAQLEAEGRVAFRYASPVNGSDNDVAGILSANGRVLGMMPHPERAVEALHGNQDGAAVFSGLAASFVAA
jgi:phosphoribosylformylglycinamidine synthase I